VGVGNATVQDLGGYLAAIALLAAVLLPAGFVLGWVTDVLAFRRRPLAGQVCLAVLIALAVCPVLTHLGWTVAGFGLVAVGYLLVVVALPVVLWRRARAEAVPDDGTAVPLLIAAGVWVVLAGIALVDVDTGSGLYRPTLHYDHAKHAAVTDAILRTGVPPENPSFRPGESQPLYYYYFWHLLGGVGGRLGGDLVTPRTLAMGGVAWAGFALLAALQVAVSLTLPGRTRWAYAVAFALPLATGLDFLPTMGMALHALAAGAVEAVPPFIDGWNGCLVTCWFGLGLWVPHHLAAVAVVAFVAAALHEAATTARPTTRATACLLAGVGFASAIGLSVWIALVAAAGLAAWGLVVLALRWWGEVANLALVGAVALVAVLPFLLELRRAQGDPRPPVAFEVRPFLFFLDFDAPLAGVHPGLVPAFHALLLPVNFALELGALLLGGVLFWRWRHAGGAPVSRGALFLLVMTVASLVVCGFFRATLRNNDLGMRGTAVAQVCLLLATVAVLTGGVTPPQGQTRETAGLRRLLWAALVVGFLGTAYDFVLGRVWSMPPSGAPARELRAAYEWLHAHTPPDAVVQHSWGPRLAGNVFNWEGPAEPFHLLYGHRQAAVSDEMHGTLFSVPRRQFDPVAEAVTTLFAAGTSPDEAGRVCARYGIDFIVVKRGDSAWDDPAGWTAHAEAAFANAQARIYRVGQPGPVATHAARK